MRAESLEQWRLELRGAIAQSPFAGRRKQPKLDYCRRQIKLLGRWLDQTDEAIFEREIRKWQQRVSDVILEKL